MANASPPGGELLCNVMKCNAMQRFNFGLACSVLRVFIILLAGCASVCSPYVLETVGPGKHSRKVAPGAHFTTSLGFGCQSGLSLYLRVIALLAFTASAALAALLARAALALLLP